MQRHLQTIKRRRGRPLKKKDLISISEIELVFEDGSNSDEIIKRTKAQAVRDIFGPGANPTRRYVADSKQITDYSNFLKGLGLKVVYTPGVWDLPHIGHCRYLQKAKECGDILIVGVELDSAVRIRKGPKRPVVPFNERVEMLCHIRHVDLVVPISDYDERGLSGMKMVEAIRPNVYIYSKRNINEADKGGRSQAHERWISDLKKLCDQFEMLESQAETSTSAKIRDLLMDMSEYAKQAIVEAQVSATTAMQAAFEDVKKRIDDAARKS